MKLEKYYAEQKSKFITDHNLTLYNTLGRKKQVFTPIHDGEVMYYSCGPTVYDYVHIGNLRAFVFADLLKRVFLFNNYKVKHVMNITDVDDKTIKASQKAHKTLKEYTEFYTYEFMKDLKSLNILIPEVVPKATETINEMVDLVKTLMDKGYAYEKDGDIYFSIEKFNKYGRLANIQVDELKENAEGRLKEDEYSKENARDFALWKAYDKDDGDVYWETELGKGRPGWHIECSAMSRKYLGQPFDIHTGGVDLVFPHHTNEIAQSEAAYGTKFCNFFVHNEHLLVNNEKMSKSKGNFYTLRMLLDKGYDPIAIRYALMSINYRQQLNFTEENLKASETALKKLRRKVLELKKEVKDFDIDLKSFDRDSLNVYLEHFIEAINDDLNISSALAVLWDVVKDDEISNAMKLYLIYHFDLVFGLGLESLKDARIPKAVVELADKRLEAKKSKDYTEADKLRDEIKAKGFVVNDNKDGSYSLEKV